MTATQAPPAPLAAEASPSTAHAVVTPPSATAAPAATTPPSFLEKAQAALSSKATLLAELNTLRDKVSALEKTNADFAALHTQQASRLQELEAERQQLDALLSQTQATVTTVEAAAAATVAGLGFQAAQLPAATHAQDDNVEELLAKMTAAKTNEEKFLLAAKINDLEAK